MAGTVVSALVVGCGARGTIYSQHPSIKPVAVADTSEIRRNVFASTHDIPTENVFAQWEDILSPGKSRIAQMVIVATPDRHHVGPALAALAMGYHLLIEKPMATSYEDCKRIAEAAEKAKTVCAVCHVLRYTPANRCLRDMVATGVIGEVLSITHTEPVGAAHFAHAYVRGNWKSEKESTSSLMAKSCHDIDLLQYYMGDDACKDIHSFGSLQHFRKDKKPKEAREAKRCHQCDITDTCPYSASSFYVTKENELTYWARHLTQGPPDVKTVKSALETGPYGRCVYEHDNDVVDHQSVSMEFRSGAIASFSMIATTERLCQRETAIYGSLGQLRSDHELVVRHFDFSTQKEEVIDLHCQQPDDLVLKGHGGADHHCITAFIEAVIRNDPSLVLTGPLESLESHTLVFAAEVSRKERKVVGVEEFKLNGGE